MSLPGSIRSAQPRTTAPTSRVTAATTRRRRNAPSGSLWSRATGSTRAARKKARSSRTGFTERSLSRATPAATSGPGGVGGRNPGGVHGAGLGARVRPVARDGVGDCPVVRQGTARRRADEVVDVVLAAHDLVEKAPDERLRHAGGHRGHETNPLAGEVRREHGHGDDPAWSEPRDRGEAV